jgi:hypothetical protein
LGQTVRPVLFYRVTPPERDSFFAVIATDDTGMMVVMSTRQGKWAREPVLTMADLIQPAQQFAEWDVEKIGPDDVQPPFVG